ncbi:MAG TPA: response regulator [Desulfuromonadaceae bacterium]
MSSRISESTAMAAELLVVVNNTSHAEHLRQMLERNHYRVQVARNGGEALRIANESRPELVITDAVMPNMDGFAFCRMIKEEGLRDIPVIILSSFADQLEVIKGLESGADSLITTPFDEAFLLSRIEHLKNDRNKPRCVSVPPELDISIDGRDYTFRSDRRQILNLFLSTYEAASHNNRELLRAQDELRELNARLDAANKKLEAANLELEAFSYRVSHELRRHLHAITSFSQVVTENCGRQMDENCNLFVREISSRAFDMSDFVKSLLNLSKVNHLAVTKEHVDLSAMAQIIADDFSSSEPGRNVAFSIREGLSAKGDKTLLWLLLENLMGNSWKFTSRRDEAVVEFGMAKIKGKRTFFVRDNGEGFAMCDADKLFRPFAKISKEFDGDGIGLATVHRIINHHGGRIWAEGEPGQGATFYFTL